MSDLTSMAASAIVKALEALPAATGAIISLKFLPPEALSKGQRLTAAISAYAIGTYVGRGICAYLHVSNDRLVDAIVFGVALFGMSFVSAAIGEVKPIIKALRKRWIGDVPSDQEVK